MPGGSFGIVRDYVTRSPGGVNHSAVAKFTSVSRRLYFLALGIVRV